MSAAKARLDLLKAYRRVFLDETGGVKPDARAVFRDLSAFCKLDATGLPDGPDGAAQALALALRTGRGDVFNHLNARLSEPLEPLMRRVEQEDANG